MSLPVTIYMRPDGRKLRTIIVAVKDDDAAYFRRHDVEVSLEELGDNQYAAYANWNGNEDDELIAISNGRSCEETLSELREYVERAKA